MNSMTGYGEAAGENGRYRIAVAMRSVNHRFLDLRVRMPDEHRALERQVELLLRRRLDRGRVEARLTIEAIEAGGTRVEVRRELVAELAREMESLAAEGLVAAPVRVADLVRLPGIVELQSAATEWTDEDAELLGRKVEEAVDRLATARRSEGKRLEEALKQGLAGLREQVAELERRFPEARQRAREELGARLAELFGEAGLDERRLEEEAVLLAERADVREELDRLGAHLEHFDEVMAADGAIGKRLDFLAQEILRELNTVASKCRDTEMTRAVLEGKLLCEQLREQVQNVE